MVSDLVSDLIGDLIGSLLGEELSRRRAQRKTSAQLADFKQGKKVTIPCALRYPASDHTNWSYGKLILSRGNASWQGRSTKYRPQTLNRHTTTAIRIRQISTREAWRVSRKLIVIEYYTEGTSVEIAVRRDDLTLVSRVLDIPANPM